MTDIAVCLAGAAWLIAGVATWVWLVEPRLGELDRADWWALAGFLFRWPVSLLYIKAWLHGYDAGKAGR
jgi:hypothetical protein